MVERKNRVEELLLYILRVAIGTQDVDAVYRVDDEEWAQLYALARRQGVLAITFDGIMKLAESDADFAKRFPQQLKLQWIHAVLNIENRYDYSRAVCADIAEAWAQQGIKTLCLKGMAFSTYYPQPSHRECGDFDCYLFDNYAKGNAIARELGAAVDDGWYKHSEMVYRKVMIENHQYIVAVRSGKSAKALHCMLDSIARNEARKYIADTKIEVPSTMFNALFMNYHSLTHFLSEGIRLRHILDWTLFLKAEQEKLDWSQFYALCDEYGMRAFADCITAIATDAFGLKITNRQVVVNSPHAERVLDAVLQEERAVFSQNVGAWSKRAMLVRNLFTSSWKYKAFTDTNIVAKFASLVWGYIAHPEQEE